MKVKYQLVFPDGITKWGVEDIPYNIGDSVGVIRCSMMNMYKIKDKVHIFNESGYFLTELRLENA